MLPSQSVASNSQAGYEQLETTGETVKADDTVASEHSFHYEDVLAGIEGGRKE